ncbi:anti-sigma regulatory factor (Ser/Thr protein kinase) [Actinocorallia herbida]|uniref:Anti-sigma regulatory factor (Ser/Thr protein kinase) n=1 Tax=Actinocorallia herbida TaxID=58109 RepID=A0A3N1D985_9ACTN|nr:ATP-binding protein [Actinocorallia herbida]ROO90029.1 anti-sigma regulatory factor (Ser/Thr protein kinase) [Actinocorallia herbida]
MYQSRLGLIGFSHLKPDVRMPARARTWVAEAAVKYATPCAIDTLRLLTSEAATNAVQYGGAGIVRISLLHGPGVLRVEVSDEGGGIPVPRIAEDDDEDGRGLFLLDALALSWGHTPAPDGKGTTVWFEIDPDASA